MIGQVVDRAAVLASSTDESSRGSGDLEAIAGDDRLEDLVPPEVLDDMWGICIATFN